MSRRVTDTIGLGLVLASVLSLGYFTYSCMERIREGLASRLFEQQRDMAGLTLALARAASVLHESSRSEPPRSADVNHALDDITAVLGNMRHTY